MREISVNIIKQKVADLFIEAEYILPVDVKNKIIDAIHTEDNDAAKNILRIILENADIAEKKVFPLCQDTGMAFIYLEIGQEVYFTKGSLKDAVYSGVSVAFQEGYLRKSIVSEPLRRKNTGNNLPPIIFTEIVEGDRVTITVVPKGFGAENQSAVKMFTPSATEDDIINFVADGVIASGSKGCPPGIIGIGIGGSFDYAANLSKKALLLPVNENNPDGYYAEIEKEILKRINASGIGPMGIGGLTTALSVRILQYPTHIAGLPVAYNYCCHSLRHASTVI